jgi:hypothetical protein
MNEKRLSAHRLRRHRALPVTLVGLLVLAGHGWAAAEEAVVPESARPMTGVELYMLYRNRSWQWPDGAGRMQDEGRVFKAWSGSGEEASWAEGRWIVTDAGLLCLQAEWHGKADTFEDRTCFSHKMDGRTVYQKKEPSGGWYVFRQAQLQESDEFSKLVREDLVTEKLEALHASRQQSELEGTSIVQQSPNSEAKGEIR